MLTKRLCLAVLLALLCIRARAAEPAISFTRDVVYGQVGDEQLKLNIAWPKADAPAGGRPCIVVIHGGAWREGDRRAHDNIVRLFAAKGYVSATVGYRFCPKFLFPAQVQDVKCAVRFLRAHAATYGIDKSRFGAVGFSAGAHLSMMLGVMDAGDGLDDSGGNNGESSKVQAVVSYFGPTDLTQKFEPISEKLLFDFIGGTREQKMDAYRQASPVIYVNAGDAPMLLFQGTKDPLVPWDQAVRMASALTRAGVPGRVELLIGASHGWGGADLEETANQTYAWFDRYLRKPGQ